MSQSFIDQHKRDRCARALARALHELGLEKATVTVIAKRAQISRATFYALFENQQEALRYARGLGIRLLKEAVDAAVAEAQPWKAKVEAAMEGLLEVVCDEPHLAELCLTGSSDEELVAILATLLREGRHESADGSPGPCTEELLARGILAIVVDRLRRGDLEDLAKLGTALADVATAPFRGPPREARAAAAE